MKRSAEDWDAHVSAMLTEGCAAAKGGDAFFGSFVISSIIEKLKADESLTAPLAAYLAEALEECLVDPTNAGKALRLAAPTKGRPKGSSAQRDFEIVHDIFDMVKSGQPLRGNQKGQEGAFAAAAGKHHVSESRAAQLWRASRIGLKEAKARKAVDEAFIDLSCEPPEVPPVRKIKVEK